MNANVYLHPAARRSGQVITLLRHTGTTLRPMGRFAKLVPATRAQVEAQITDIQRFVKAQTNNPGDTAC
jgi:hypothetical protein